LTADDVNGHEDGAMISVEISGLHFPMLKLPLLGQKH